MIRSRPSRLPPLTPAELDAAPELAVLVLLGEALVLATHALFAAHPELESRELHDRRAAEVWVAGGICQQAFVLQAAVDAYRQAVELREADRSAIGKRDVPF